MKMICNACSKKYEDRGVNTKYSNLCPSCVQRAIELDDRLSEMNKKDIIDEIKNKFNNMETYGDLLEILFYQLQSYEAPYFEIRSKRSSKSAYSFSLVKGKEDRVHYLYNDAVSTGECNIQTLNNYLTLKFW